MACEAPAALKDDREMWLEAVKQNGNALKYAHGRAEGRPRDRGSYSSPLYGGERAVCFSVYKTRGLLFWPVSYTG